MRRSSDLRDVSPEERERRIRDFVESRPTAVNGALDRLREELLDYEVRFGMSSDTMARLIREGTLQETDAYCRWLMLLDRRNRLESAREPAEQ